MITSPRSSDYRSASSSRRWCVAALLAGLILAGCGGGGTDPGANPAGSTIPGRTAGGLTVRTLNSIKGEQYQYRQKGGTITVAAPRTNRPAGLGGTVETGKGVIGEAFWKSGQIKRADQQVCARLDSVPDTSSVESVQQLLDDPATRHLPGLALRVRPGVDGAPMYAITVTQRVNKAAVWGFDVTGLRVDVADPSAAAVANVAGSVDFDGVVGSIQKLMTPNMTTDMKPPPWNLCARVIGTTVTLKLWVGSVEPSWTDAKATGEVKLSRSWVFDGYAGGYEQGLSPGHSSKFTDLVVSSPY